MVFSRAKFEATDVKVADFDGVLFHISTVGDKSQLRVSVLDLRLIVIVPM